MMPTLHAVSLLSPVAAVAADSLVASVWEGLLLVAWVALCLRLVPKLSASARSLIWITVLTVVVLLPVLGLRTSSNAHIAGSGHGIVQLHEGWSLALAILWASISLFRLVQLAMSAARLRTLAREAVPVEGMDSAIAVLLQSGGRGAELCASDDVDRPSVAGFFRPRILLPTDLLATMSTAELEQVVLHEMEHLRRRDDWTNLLQKLALALLPLNPVLMWLDRRLCTERELACDDGVMRATNARKAYAACLASLAEASIARRGVLLALGIFGKGRTELERRVYRILGRPEGSLSGSKARVATGFLLAGVACGAVALAHSPKLISFGASESPAVVAQAAPVVGPLAPRAAAGTAHMTLAKAMVSAPRPRMAVEVRTERVRKPMAIKAVHRTSALPHPHVVLASWTAETYTAPRFVHTGVLLAVDEDSHFTYAAVPVRGGWLIVQL